MLSVVHSRAFAWCSQMLSPARWRRVLPYSLRTSGSHCADPVSTWIDMSPFASLRQVFLPSHYNIHQGLRWNNLASWILFPLSQLWKLSHASCSKPYSHYLTNMRFNSMFSLLAVYHLHQNKEWISICFEKPEDQLMLYPDAHMHAHSLTYFHTATI